MDIKDISQENISSLQSAISTVMMRKAMNQDAQTVTALLQDMQANTSSVLENSITPYKGAKIDLRV